MFTAFAIVTFILIILALISARATKRLTLRYPPTGSIIKVDEMDIHYTIINKGEITQRLAPNQQTIIMLHGASCNSRDFLSSIAYPLSKEYQIICIDRPGFGHSQRKARQWLEPAQQAEIVKNVIDKLNLSAISGDHKPILLGHSWSSVLVLNYLLKYQSELHAAILLAPVSHPWPTPPALYNTITMIPIIGKVFTYCLVYPIGKRFIDPGIKTVFYQGATPENYRENCAIDLLLRPVSWVANAEDMYYLKAYIRKTYQQYEDITLPVLNIIGEKDHIVSNQIHTEALVKQISTMKTVAFPNTGHAPHHSRLEVTVQHILKFIE